MDKRGQFFLVAAGVICVIIISLGIIYNFAQVEKTSSTTLAMAPEIKEELIQIAENGIYNKVDQAEMDARSLSLARNYSRGNPDTNFFFVYGSNNSITYKYLKNGVEDPLFYSNVNSDVSALYLKLDAQTTYTFNKTKGQNIYVVVYRELNDERYVSSA